MNMKNLTERQNIVIAVIYNTTHPRSHIFSHNLWNTSKMFYRLYGECELSDGECVQQNVYCNVSYSSDGKMWCGTFLFNAAEQQHCLKCYSETLPMSSLILDVYHRSTRRFQIKRLKLTRTF